MILIDGSSRIDLTKNGYHIQELDVSIGGYKDGGVYEESDLVAGRKLISKKFALSTIRASILVRGVTQDDAIRKQNNLISMLRNSVDYWSSNRAETPVYVIDQAHGEENPRYASIYNARIDKSTTVMDQPFNQLDGSIIGIDFQIWVENWKSNAPNSYSPLTISTTRETCAGEFLEVTHSSVGDEYTALTQLDSGRILVYNSTDESVYYSDDLGETLTLLTALPGVTGTAYGRDMVVTPNGNVVLTTTSSSDAADRGVWLSTDNGANWSKLNISSTSYQGFFSVFIDEEKFKTIACGTGTSSANHLILVSGDDFATWSEESVSGNTTSVVKIKDEKYLAIGDLIYESRDSGVSWSYTGERMPISNTVIKAIVYGERIYTISLSSSHSYYSDNEGADWVDTDIWEEGNNLQALNWIGDSGYLGAGGGGLYRTGSDGQWVRIINVSDDEYYAISDLIDDNSFLVSCRESSLGILGRVKPCFDVGNSTTKYISNAYQESNITHVKYYENLSTSYTDIFDLNGDYDLFLIPDTGDYVYFGVAISTTDTETAPPFSLVFDLSTVASSIAFGDWEIYTGSWTAQTPYDTTGKLTSSGLVAFISPAFVSTTIDGVDAFWIRLGISSAGSPVSPRVRVNPYVVNNPYITIPSVDGDLNSRIKVNLTFPESAVSLDDKGKAARIIAGARSLSRGSNFRAYLGPRQLPTGISTTLGANSSETTENQYSSYGSVIDYSAVTVDSWLDIISFTFDENIVSEYFGTFRLFARGYQLNGTAGQMSLRYSFQYGSGGLVVFGNSLAEARPYTALDTWYSFAMHDLGLIKIPSLPSISLSPSTASTLTIQSNQSSATPDFTLIDIILIPTDEWFCDYVSKNQLTSVLDNGYTMTFQNGLKSVSKNFLKNTSGIVVGSFFDNASSEPQFGSGDQSLWFSIMSTLGTINRWTSPRYLEYSISVSGQNRYLIGRG